jgi:hypothetical protein
LDLRPVILTRVGDRWIGGPWVLPRFPGSAGVPTDAQIDIVVSDTPQAVPPSWTVEVTATYGNTNSFGLEYLTDALRISASGWFEDAVQTLDFSHQCQTAGRSLYPGGRWQISVKLPKGPDASSPSGLGISLWGRN